MIISKLRTVIYGKLVKFIPWMYRTFYGMEIGEGTIISRHANLDKNINPRGIHIGKYCNIVDALILTHDACRNMKADVYIGDNCFLGARVTILPGVRIGNQVIVGAGAVVTKNVPDNCIVAGNPARIVRGGVELGHYGVIINSL